MSLYFLDNEVVTAIVLIYDCFNLVQNLAIIKAECSFLYTSNQRFFRFRLKKKEAFFT